MLASATQYWAALLVLAIAFAPSSAAAYRTLADAEGTSEAIVWAEPPSIAVDLAGLTDEEASRFTHELQAAIETWNAPECAGEVATFAGTDPASGVVVVRMVDDWIERGFNADAAGTTDLVLASTMDGGTAIVGATLSLRAEFMWGPHPQDGTDGPHDMRAVIVHEIGHVLGLEHTEDPSAAMYAVYAGSSQAVLHDDDIAGLCSLYSSEPVTIPITCAKDDACPLGHWCIEGECQPELRYGEQCTDGSECFGARCVEAESGGACTYVCEEEADCPSGTTCLGVMGRDERVCAAPVGSSGCSVSRGRTMSFSLLLLALASVVLLAGRRSKRASRSRLGSAAATGALMLTACGTSHVDDAGVPPVDAGAMDAAPADAATPVDPGADADVEPDAGPACEPGATRIGECGFCGMQGQRCDETGRWMGTSECLGQGECALGSVETRDVERCAQEQRLCLDGCMWGEWQPSRPPGACDPGTARMAGDACPAGEIREEVCADDCTWTGATACSNPCGVTPRTTPEWAREVCVPSGNFIRGSTLHINTRPVTEVYVSSFLIDAYPVTNRRYRECLEAGACNLTPHPSYDDPARLDFPVQNVQRASAIRFCTWDGGRRLATEAEWEKAGRGPSPRMNLFPWEGSAWDCSRAPSTACGDSLPGMMEHARHPYDGLPGTRSYYGTYLHVVGVPEWVADGYRSDFYEEPGSLVDPLAPFTDTSDGVTRGHYFGVESDLTARDRRPPSHFTNDDAGFRCARDAL